MDTIIALLTTREGRIGRQQWWIGVVAMIVVSIIASIVLGILSFGNQALLGWLAVLLNLALLYPAYCIGIKRRHDRDNDGTDLKILLGGSVILNLLQASGIGADMVDVGGGIIMPVPALWLGLVNLAYAVFAIYMFVQLGFLKGTSGSNNYGLDPLDGAA
ncbi:DUF805 domain-containing protein [Devosia faecipullorum]|uniref:DUF805 domain-containing protein n=1 Tax=Devosia faecipullorum TaxID=2755039 RepID=UPI00187BAE27|nr:DUF805 domain-containing protein [Devosia faecipullorum]MBE7734194.1 DUF805 domain-containing protein [Devosia faecipullorum]